MSPDSARAPIHDRALLLGDKCNDVLGLDEVQQYGRDSFDDPDYVALYGLRPAEWYARGVRVLGRTAVECTRDALADAIARDVADVAARAGAVAGSVVVDPFAGSANTLWWITRRVAPRRAHGFEQEPVVFELTRRNLAILGLGLELTQTDHQAGLASLRTAGDDLVVVFSAPPWGDALSARAGLDLRRTRPPARDIVELVARTYPAQPVLVATQIHERVVGASLDELVARFDWSSHTTYDLDAPGRNHGLVLGTLGWTP
jgi:16S rRNA G966 N2-methylase RsmD